MPFTIDSPDPDPQQLVAVPDPIDPPDLLSDLPPFEQNSTEIRAVLRAVGNELARVEAARQQLIANFFPGSADALLHFYEQMLDLPIDSPAQTLVQRQLAVLAFMQSLKSQGTGLEWEAIVTSLIGTAWTYHEHDPADGTSPPPYTILIRMPFVAPVSTPAGLAAVDAGAGGLAAGTWSYAVTATTVYGETVPCAHVDITVAAGRTVDLTWTAQAAPVTGFKVYRGATPTTLEYLATVGTNAFADNGSLPPGAPAPTVDSSGSPQAVTVLKLTRAVTQAHIVIEAGYTAGFIVGISDIGIDAL